jgi:hypothetical protein
MRICKNAFTLTRPIVSFKHLRIADYQIFYNVYNIKSFIGSYVSNVINFSTKFRPLYIYYTEEFSAVLVHVRDRGEFRPRQLPRAVDLKGRFLSCQSY